MPDASNVLAALGLAFLMVIHESGHYLAARRFGMRVTKFSIGFGPTLWRHRPKGSPTVFQVAIIPFLAYVQIAGMNPYEKNDPEDKGSYANASLWARIVTIVGGPLANYLFASVLFFAGYTLGGREEIDTTSMRVSVAENGPAAQSGIESGDRIVSVNGEAIHTWEELKSSVGKHAGEPIDVTVERAGETLVKRPTPAAKGAEHEGKILIGPQEIMVKVGVAEAALLSVTTPAKVVYDLVRGLARLVTGKEKVELSGPVGIVRGVAGAVRVGPGKAFWTLGLLSAYLGGFNLLPIPALDGGRLLFLLFEAASRRKPDAKVETGIHAVGLIMMLALIAVVTWTEIMPKH